MIDTQVDRPTQNRKNKEDKPQELFCNLRESTLTILIPPLVEKAKQSTKQPFLPSEDNSIT